MTRRRLNKQNDSNSDLVSTAGVDAHNSSNPSSSSNNGKHVSFLSNGKAPVNATADGYLPPSGRGMRPSPSLATLNRLDRQKIVLWRQPLVTLKFFLLELLWLLKEALERLWKRKLSVILFAILCGLLYLAYTFDAPYQYYINYIEKKAIWYAYWVGLGVLSSIGLGSGLHTFLLYLGPHIASVTLAAYECDSLKFPEPPYPEQIVCPYSNGDGGVTERAAESMAVVGLWSIVTKVRWESLMWGAGTALGELPPYFMARAARLSGEEPDDEEYHEFLAYMRAIQEGDTTELGYFDRAKMYVEKLVERVGFVGILLCASIPNPIFDLAGITCGHFLVPFWKFFGATLIGKAVFKMHFQMLFVVVVFSERHVDHVIGLLRHIPKIGRSLQAPFKEYLKQQKIKLHRKPGEHIHVPDTWIQLVFGSVVFVMVAYFVLSIVNSLAQSYHKRLWTMEKAGFSSSATIDNGIVNRRRNRRID